MNEIPPLDYGTAFASQGAILKVAGESDFEGVLTWMKENPNKISHSGGLSEAVGLRLTADPGEFLSRLNEEGVLEPMLGAIGSSLSDDASAMSQEVWEWALNQEPSESVRALRRSVIRSLSWPQSKTVISLVDQMAPGPEREDAFKKVVSGASHKARDLAVFDDLTNDLSPEWQSALARSTFARLSEQEVLDPSGWSERLELVEPEERPRSVHLLARAWAQSDVNASIEWVESLENSVESAEGTGGVAVGWFDSDPEGAAQWAAGLDGAKLDAAASAVAERLAGKKQYDEALSWLDRVQSAEKAYEALDLVAQGISNEEALRWVESSHFSPEQKEDLNRFVEQSR